jgi:hypothetical protein
MANITIFNKDVFINIFKLTKLIPSKPLILNSIKNINSAIPTNTELSYLENLTSSFNTQYNSKVQLYDISGNKVTNNPRILYGDLSGNVSSLAPVVFNPPFTSTPLVFGNINQNLGGTGRCIQIRDITVNGFNVGSVPQAGGSYAENRITWIAIGI